MGPPWAGTAGNSILGTRLELEQGVPIAFVLVMLFVRGPIEQVASGLPAAVQVQVAFRRIAAVLADFTQYEPDLLSERPTGVFPALQALELRDVSYTHLDSAGQPTFHLGPLDLHLEAGQRKRLALIVALLEDRPILVLDEWAADQDPAFRQFFYDTLLKDLKAQGKTIIAATHDDRYFGVADRVIKMEYGQFTQS